MRAEPAAELQCESPRLPLAGPARMVHGLALGLLQPVIPFCVFVALAPLVVGSGGVFRSLTIGSIAATAAIPLLLNVLLVRFALMSPSRVSPRDLGWVLPAKPMLETAFALFGLSAYLFLYAVTVLSLQFNSEATFSMSASYPLSARILLLFVGANVAFFEESVFRGYLQPAMIDKLGEWGGIVTTAFLFAAWNPLHFTMEGFILRLTLGLITGVLRGSDRPLMSAFVFHMLVWPLIGIG